MFGFVFGFLYVEDVEFEIFGEFLYEGVVGCCFEEGVYVGVVFGDDDVVVVFVGVWFEYDGEVELMLFVKCVDVFCLFLCFFGW